MIRLQQYKDFWYGYDAENDRWVISDNENGTNIVTTANAKYLRIDEAIAIFRIAQLPYTSGVSFDQSLQQMACDCF